MMLRLFAIIAVLIPVAARAEEPPVTPEQVDKAIQKAIEYLYSQQQNANWESVQQRNPNAPQWDVTGYQWGGLTGVATCALLAAGVSPQDAHVRSALDWMLKAECPGGIYAMGFRCQVWQMSGRPEAKAVATKDKQYLLDAVRKQGDGKGFYDYVFTNAKLGGEPNWWDHSVSQYGVLATWACAQMGIEIPTEYWRVTEIAWRSHQMQDGGWSYRFNDNSKPIRSQETLSMTAAGLATLFITQEMLHTTDTLECRGNYKDEHIDRAMKWMAANFYSYKDHFPCYSLYGVERVGVAGGYKYIGTVNWYQEGANFLVRTQRPDGSWGQAHNEENPKCIPDTAFGLMFLARGRAPVMINKLQYALLPAEGKPAAAAHWNQRPRDVANLTRWTSKTLETGFNWQIVNLDAPVEELQEAPILYIAGNENLAFSAENIGKLRKFIAYGGLIVGNADCNSKPFIDSFQKLGAQLVPGGTFRELPADHPVYTSQMYKRTPLKTFPVQGLSNGVRELMVLLPTDPSRFLQARSFVGAEREAASQMLVNLYVYASKGAGIRFKGHTHIVAADPAVIADRKIPVARLEYAGNWDPEPAGWQRMSAILHNTQKTDLTMEAVRLGDGRLLTGKFPLAHLTGTGKLDLPADQQAELKKYLESGGTLLIDSAGGSDEFTAGVQGLLAALVPGGKLTLLPADHPLYTQPQPITAFEYRPFSKKKLGNARGPRLQAIEINGRPAVFFSPDDLSSALTGTPTDGITGYAPPTAVQIVAHLLQSAAK